MYKFYLGSVSQDFTKDRQSEISLNGTVYDFSVDHNPIKREDILNIHLYLMIKNNIRKCLGYLKKIIRFLISLVNGSNYTKCILLRNQ